MPHEGLLQVLRLLPASNPIQAEGKISRLAIAQVPFLKISFLHPKCILFFWFQNLIPIQVCLTLCKAYVLNDYNTPIGHVPVMTWSGFECTNKKQSKHFIISGVDRH